MTLLSGRRALVTGANRGIGAACAKALAHQGARVFCADICKPDTVTATIKSETGDNSSRSVACDVADEQSVREMFAIIDRRLGGLDILVHCANLMHERSLLDTPVSEFDRVIAVNLRGTFLVGREAIRLMEGRYGRIILVASDLAYRGREAFSTYVASKHGVLGLARSWAEEFAPQILVNAICPGPIDTEMPDARHLSEARRQKEQDIPLQRLGQPEEVAGMATFLAGPSATFITGQGFGVNGGSVMA